MRFLWKSAAACAVAAGAAVAFFVLPHGLDPIKEANIDLNDKALVERGRYLTLAGDCAACHTAPRGKPFAGGLAFELPFGKIYSANITPDVGSGIGSWNGAEFVRAMRHGVGKNGEDLYPAFPYTSYAKLTDADMIAIFAYLKTLAPVDDPAPRNQLAFPFNQRWSLRAWKLLFLNAQSFQPDTKKSAQWNRGAYLVQGLAHCGECHTPRNILFARQSSEELSGGTVDGWQAWNITSDMKSGIGAWTDAAIAHYLSAGWAEGHGAATGSMKQAIDLSLSKLEAGDVDAIVTYLRSVPPVESGDPAPTLTTSSMARARSWSSGDPQESVGKSLFEGACASCHGWEGSGQATRRQSLIGGRNVSDPEGTNLIRLLLEGASSENNDAGQSMPSFAAAYDDQELAALANYVIAHFGGKQGLVTPDTVKSARAGGN